VCAAKSARWRAAKSHLRAIIRKIERGQDDHIKRELVLAAGSPICWTPHRGGKRLLGSEGSATPVGEGRKGGKRAPIGSALSHGISRRGRLLSNKLSDKKGKKTTLDTRFQRYLGGEWGISQRESLAGPFPFDQHT